MRLLALIALAVLVAAPAGVAVGLFLVAGLGVAVAVGSGLYGVLGAFALLSEVPSGEHEVTR